MIIKQSITAPVPQTGDSIHWTANGKDYTAQVKSKTFAYDRSEVSMARTDDWGVTITVLVDIVMKQ